MRLAPRDPLVREIQRALDLIRPHEPHGSPLESPYDGYCGVATQAYLTLSGLRPPVLCIYRLEHEVGVHWWLEHETRGIIDVTLSARERRKDAWFSYDEGCRASFQGGYDRPSARARVLIDLVERLRVSPA